jgi:sugar lactone lactonase YvrE
MAIQTRCLVNPPCSLGEGPTWDAGSQRLYWVDILENRIYRYDPADESTSSWATPEHVGFVVVRPDGGLVAGFKSGLHHVALNEDGSVAASRIDRVDRSRADVRFNDATRTRRAGSGPAPSAGPPRNRSEPTTATTRI